MQGAKAVVGESVVEGAKHVIAGSEEWFAQQQSSINALTKKYMETEGLSERTARWKATKELLNQSAK